MVYKGTFDGSQTIAAQGITTIQKGWFWKVTVAGTTSGVNTPSNAGVNVGDMVIANVTKSSGITAADFDGVDNTESSDLVKLAANADTDQQDHRCRSEHHHQHRDHGFQVRSD